MKALNTNEITKRYLIFLAYFGLLLLFSMLCIHLFHKTTEVYTVSLHKQKTNNDLMVNKRMELSMKIDSLNTLLTMLNTAQVRNEVALERAIIKLKRSAKEDLDFLETETSMRFPLHQKLIHGIETSLDYKKGVDQALKIEVTQRKKLFECMDANDKAHKALTTPANK